MYPFDEESRRRVQRHQKMRQGKGFETAECYTGLHKVQVPENSTVLLECMSNLVANEMYDPSGAGENAEESILAGIHKLQKVSDDLVVVTNEVFSDGCEYDAGTTDYIRRLGEINVRLSRAADAVVEVVYSIPVFLKGDIGDVDN